MVATTWDTGFAMRVSRGGGEALTEPLRRARFDEVVLVHRPNIEAVALKMCRQRAQAADLVQDTFERAWRNFETLLSDDCARAWLIRIMRNTWIDLVRKRRPEVSIEAVNEVAEDSQPEQSPWERVTLDDIRSAIERLEEPFRSVAVLHDIDGLTYREIAVRLAIPYPTAATRLHRARARVRELLASKLEEGPP